MIGILLLAAAVSASASPPRDVVVAFTNAYATGNDRQVTALLELGANIGHNDIGGKLTPDAFRQFLKGCKLRRIADAAVAIKAPSGRDVSAVDTWWQCTRASALERWQFDVVDGLIVSIYSGGLIDNG